MVKSILAFIIGILGFALLLISVTLLPTSSYPTFTCNYCHNQEVQAWKQSTHKGVSCLTCHKSPKELDLATRAKFNGMIVSYFTGSYRRPIQASVKNEICEKCHRQDVQQTVERKRIIVRHRDILKNGSRCTDCHNTIAHGKITTNSTYPNMDSCALCHDGKKASKKCDLCHSKKVGPLPTARVGPWWVTHSGTWVKTHGMGDQRTCQACHREDFCVKCHSVSLPHPDGWPFIHGQTARPIMNSCRTCHLESFCFSCHQIEMPHPDGFLPRHSKEAKRLGLNKNCYRCHTAVDCDQCHIKHVHPGILKEKSEVERLAR